MANERVRVGLHQGGQTDVWSAPERFKVVAAGRRWGKTLFARTWLLALAFKMGRGRYWYVGPSREDAKDTMWEDLKAACHPAWVAGRSEVELSVTLINGAEVRIWSAEKSDGLRGRKLRALVMDEYADMEGRLFHEVLRPSLTDYRAPALFIGTPKSFNHFYQLYEWGQDSTRPTWKSWQFKSLDNPLFDAQELEDARRDTDPRTFRQEYEASFEAVSGRAYYAFRRQTHVSPVALERAVPLSISFDFNVHPAVAVLGQKIGDEVRVWREVWVEHAGGEATRLSASGARRLVQDIGWDGPIRIYGDPAGTAAKTTGPSDHQVVREVFAGMSVTWCIPGRAPHVRDRVSAVNGRCETMDGLRHCVIDPACPRLIADLEQVIFADNGDLDKKRNELLTHISDAFGYWVVKDFPPVTVAKGGAARVEWLL